MYKVYINVLCQSRLLGSDVASQQSGFVCSCEYIVLDRRRHAG